MLYSILGVCRIQIKSLKTSEIGFGKVRGLDLFAFFKTDQMLDRFSFHLCETNVKPIQSSFT